MSGKFMSPVCDVDDWAFISVPAVGKKKLFALWFVGGESEIGSFVSNILSQTSSMMKIMKRDVLLTY